MRKNVIQLAKAAKALRMRKFEMKCWKFIHGAVDEDDISATIPAPCGSDSTTAVATVEEKPTEYSNPAENAADETVASEKSTTIASPPSSDSMDDFDSALVIDEITGGDEDEVTPDDAVEYLNDLTKPKRMKIKDEPDN